MAAINHNLVVIITLSFCGHLVDGFNNGPPVQIFNNLCATLDPSPGHGATTATGASPYTVSTTNTNGAATSTYTVGQPVRVNIAGTTTYRGFFIVARRTSDNIIVGTWRNIPTGTQGMNCPATGNGLGSQGGVCAANTNCGNGWAHSRNIDKSNIRGEWLPSANDGQVCFDTTVVTGPTTVYRLDVGNANGQTCINAQTTSTSPPTTPPPTQPPTTNHQQPPTGKGTTTKSGDNHGINITAIILGVFLLISIICNVVLVYYVYRGFRNKNSSPKEGVNETNTPNVPQTYMELNHQTRQQESTYEQPKTNDSKDSETAPAYMDLNPRDEKTTYQDLNPTVKSAQGTGNSAYEEIQETKNTQAYVNVLS